MSLLNDMLRNLEKRNQEHNKKHLGQIVIPELQAAPPSKKKPWELMLKPLVICLMILLLITTGYLSIKLVDLLKKKHLLDFLSTPAINQKLAKLTPSFPKSNTTLQNIFITRGTSEIVIQFIFDTAVRYQLTENNDHSQSTITLNDVNFNANLPLLPVAFVKALTTKTVGNDLQITMETAPGTEIKIMQDQTQKPVRLIFILTNNTSNQKPTVLVQPIVSKTQVPPTPEELALTDYQDALNLVDHGYPDQAIPLLAKVVQNDPQLVAARKMLVTLLIQNNEINSATDYVKSGLKIRPDAIELLELDAKLLLLKHHPEEALHILQKASPPITQEPEYYALLASVQQQLGRATIAEQIYTQLLTLDESNANWWLGIGLAMETQKKNNNALQAYQQAARLGGLSPRLQANVQERIVRLTR